jgi:hypothetical protein
MKTTLTCQEWRSFQRNTLQGFAKIQIAELHLIISDIAVHQKDGRRWAQLPARPQIKDGVAVTDAGGRVQYFPVMAFETRDVANAFSSAVVAAVLKHDSDAFSLDRAERAPPPAPSNDMNDEIPF